jgi:hypothetical protein
MALNNVKGFNEHLAQQHDTEHVKAFNEYLAHNMTLNMLKHSMNICPTT